MGRDVWGVLIQDVFGDGKEHAEEAIVDSILLIVRNVIQLFRLLAMLKK